MAVVVDASAICAIAFGEPEGPTLAAHLKGQTLLAPALIDFELASVALKKVRAHPDDRAKISLALHMALTLPISRVTVPGSEAVALAAATGLTAYDASYLWVARSRDAELVTLDDALQRVAQS